MGNICSDIKDICTKIRETVHKKSAKLFHIRYLRLKVKIMDSTLKARLKGQIQAYMEKNPTAELREVRNWLETDNSLLEGIQYNPKTLKSFIFYQLRKFKSGSDVRKHLGGNGRPPISKRKEGQILRLSINKENSGLRPVAKLAGVHYITVRNVLKKNINNLKIQRF